MRENKVGYTKQKENMQKYIEEKLPMAKTEY
jgi:hypothetical protein